MTLKFGSPLFEDKKSYTKNKQTLQNIKFVVSIKTNSIQGMIVACCQI